MKYKNDIKVIYIVDSKELEGNIYFNRARLIMRVPAPGLDGPNRYKQEHSFLTKVMLYL